MKLVRCIGMEDHPVSFSFIDDTETNRVHVTVDSKGQITKHIVTRIED